MDPGGLILIAGELGEQPVAARQFRYQQVALFQNPVELPVRARVELRQVTFGPAPFFALAHHLQETPVGRLRRTNHGLSGLEIERPACELQALGFVARAQIARDALQDQQVGIEVVRVELFTLVHRALGLGTQPVDLRVLGGIGLEQHQFEQRLVRGIDTFEQLPVRNAEEFLSRQRLQAPEVEPLVGSDETFLDQLAGVGGVVGFVFRWHRPPQQGVAGQ